MSFTFADLFAGIGGFHAALGALGGECWFASDIDGRARLVYERNWRTAVDGDIVPLTDGQMAVPPHDVLARVPVPAILEVRIPAWDGRDARHAVLEHLPSS